MLASTGRGIWWLRAAKQGVASAGMGVLLDLLVPPRCAACATPTAAGLCEQCAADAQPLRLPDGQWEALSAQVVAVGVYAYDGVVRDAVHGLKIGGRHAAARPLGEDLRRHRAIPPAWPVTWVPSSRRRLRQRGFDVPRLLAGAGATRLLRRVVDRPDQTSLDAEQRRRSPRGVFEAVDAAPLDVVLVDDVRTTGATALSAAQTLLKAGARRVLVTTLAVGGDDARAGR